MFSFRDKTYCASINCKNDCDRKITDELINEANKAGIPIAYAYFCGGEIGENRQLEERLWE